MSDEKPRLSPEDRIFFKRLGERIATYRKERGLTQVQLATLLDESQQRIGQFEKGLRRITVSRLADVAKALGVSVEDLLGDSDGPSRRGPASLLQRQVERISKLPRSKQRFVTEMIELALQRAQG